MFVTTERMSEIDVKTTGTAGKISTIDEEISGIGARTCATREKIGSTALRIMSTTGFGTMEPVKDVMRSARAVSTVELVRSPAAAVVGEVNAKALLS